MEYLQRQIADSSTSSILRAYVFAHASTTGPTLLSFLLTIGKKSLDRRQACAKLLHILRSSLDYNRFPAFCATLIGGYQALQHAVGLLLSSVVGRQAWVLKSTWVRLAISRFVAAFVASWASLMMLNASKPSRKSDDALETVNTDGSEEITSPRRDVTHRKLLVPGHRPLLAGKTLDLTLLVSVRALDAVVGDLWQRRITTLWKRGRVPTRYETISQYTDATVFAASAGAVMWAWFYLPERLPRAYNKWIGEAAQVDQRLVEVLRQARRGEFVYGKETGQASMLQNMCRDYNWPLVWGDPAQTIPIPCEMVHMGCGRSCHYHAVARFARAFKFSFLMYLPLQMFVKARHPSVRAFKWAVKDAVRSSAFLGAFISIFYYSVCLSRTLLGPKIFGPDTVTPMMWDSGLCIGAGCVLCGWSILIEAAKRRQEVAFFVAPRAAATLLPRRYEQKYFWREQVAFSLSTATLFTYVQSNPANVRGVLGQVLYGVLG